MNEDNLPYCKECFRTLGEEDEDLLEDGVCIDCIEATSHAPWMRITNTPEERMYYNARARARRQKVPFGLTPKDIVIPTHCPILGIDLKRCLGRMGDCSPTLDKIDPSLGYVKGNIAVISSRANRIKNNGTAEEHEKIAAWMKTHASQ